MILHLLNSDLICLMKYLKKFTQDERLKYIKKGLHENVNFSEDLSLEYPSLIKSNHSSNNNFKSFMLMVFSPDT